MPCDGRAPIMSDNHGGFFAQRIEHTHHIAHQVQQRIAFDFGRVAGIAVAAHVRSDGMKSGFR